jgi:hypothetical protein
MDFLKGVQKYKNHFYLQALRSNCFNKFKIVEINLKKEGTSIEFSGNNPLGSFKDS